MSVFGELYAKCYDLVYESKEYDSEVDYVSSLIKKYAGNSKSILDLGCGTGKHAELFLNKGHSVHGVDLSDEMLEIAKKRIGEENSEVRFSCANITELSLDKKFDTVVSLFHVMGYLTTNANVGDVFRVASDHLNQGGLFIFDFWYGPGVLTDMPETRIKRFGDDDIDVTRLSEPEFFERENMVRVNYHFFIKDKKSSEIIEKSEKHDVRYFFDPELEMFCESNGFEIAQKLQWLTDESPSFGSWYVVWVLRKK
ncbi:MAG: class I SAM-dependent methyltransferase [Bacteriovoracaceae bacterium]|jgi:SAM-dependent methyltransferase|nr:class I SAM-dependent methyltransferase [Bacteriovoracaceae bacterium]